MALFLLDNQPSPHSLTCYHCLHAGKKFVFLTGILVAQVSYSLPEDYLFSIKSSETLNYFIENIGQWPSDVFYLCRLPEGDIWITRYGLNIDLYQLDYSSGSIHPYEHNHKLNYTLRGHRLLIRFRGKVAHPIPQGVHRLLAHHNYLLGEEGNWKASRADLYGEVIVRNIYEGIDVHYRFDRGKLRWDFIIHPGAHPNDIILEIEAGGSSLQVDTEGNLIIETQVGKVIMGEINSYSLENMKKVETHFVLRGNTCGFKVEGYNPDEGVVVDPIIYSTLIGGSQKDVILDVTTDNAGDVYVTGRTWSANYDVTPGAYQAKPVKGIWGGNTDAFITKLNAEGNALVYSTYFSGERDEEGRGIAVDREGNVYITGWTTSCNFPVTSTAFRSQCLSKRCPSQCLECPDIFVAKLNTTGSRLIYSTFAGGCGVNVANDIAVDENGQAWVTGFTFSESFPTTYNAYQFSIAAGSESPDAFLLGLDPQGTKLLYSTYLGGEGHEEGRALTLDKEGAIYLTGVTTSSSFTSLAQEGKIFVVKFSPLAASLSYSIRMGGSERDEVFSIAVDDKGCAYIAGTTLSKDFPVTRPVFQREYTPPRPDMPEGREGFVAKLNAEGSGLAYATFIGGSGDDRIYDIKVDTRGFAYVVGTTNSDDFPVTDGCFQQQRTSMGSSDYDGFLVKLHPTGRGVSYATYLGGRGQDVAYAVTLSGDGSICTLAGATESPDFPTTKGAYQVSHSAKDQESPAKTSQDEVLKMADAFVTRMNLSSYERMALEGFDIALRSPKRTESQELCARKPIEPIIYDLSGIEQLEITGLPPGLTWRREGDSLLIQGAPQEAGHYAYTVTARNRRRSLTARGTLTIKPLPSVKEADTSLLTQQLCPQHPLRPIILEIAHVNKVDVVGLPPGVRYDLAKNELTIQGTPREIGNFKYSIVLRGKCGDTTVAGSIAVRPYSILKREGASDTPMVWVGEELPPITYTVREAAGVEVTGLPAGVQGTFQGHQYVIAGIPQEGGTFTYGLRLIEGCGNVTAQGAIRVNVPLSNKKIGTESRWQAFPLTVRKSFTVRTRRSLQLELLTPQGKQLRSYTVSPPKTQLEETLPPGIYILREPQTGYATKLTFK